MGLDSQENGKWGSGFLYHLQLTHSREVNRMAAVTLTPCSVNSDFAGLCGCWDHWHHCAHTSRAPRLVRGCLRGGVLARAASWKPWLLRSGSTEATSGLCYMKLCGGPYGCYCYCQPGENKCVFSLAMAARARSSLLAHALPTLGSGNSADSMNSETAGAVSRSLNLCVIHYIFKW